ncbi:MAG: EAL domain-containing protein [Lachnospiraceae bacterium]|nr:EAL domain-containing protein [Lachnospiraceae bacterium]
MIKRGWITQLHESGMLIATILMGVAMLIYTLVQRRIEKKQNKAFVALVAIVAFDALTDVVKIFALTYYAELEICRALVHLMRYLYFATHSILSAIFFYYVLLASGMAERMTKKESRIKGMLYMIPMGISLLLALTNPFTHLVYVLGSEGHSFRGPGEGVIYLVSILYFALAAFTLIVNWHSISRMKKTTTIIFFMFSLTGILIQLLDSRIRCELFAEMLALGGIMLMVENEDERLDMSTRVYNRSALISDLMTTLKLLPGFEVVCVRITNADTLQRLLGTADTEILIRLAADYLCTVHPRQYIYHTTPDSFILICPGGDDQAYGLAEKIRGRFSESFEFLETQFDLQAVVMCCDVKNIFERNEDILLLCDGPLPSLDKDHVLEDSELDYLVRQAEVESALHRGISERRFEVYYQPVYRMKGMSIYSAEALLRLKDSKIGNIMPDEFIPIAEQNGLIGQLGDYVLEEVCLFLSSGIPTEMGLDCIEINLSVLQCLRPGFVDSVLRIVRKYDVEPRFINFEVTESAATSDYAVLDAVLNDLKAAGFLLSLDDYGIGYSNVRSVFSLDFDLVKIDKSILWEVEGDTEAGRKGRVILENSVRMIRQMKLKILVEGVETYEQLELLEDLEVDYLQGYYFSRPVSKNELLGILRVTELARMEEQRARAASDAKSNFLANMSHEIRTPINAILGMNEMILRESKNKHILEYAQNIEGAGRTLVSLINDILDFSKIESGSMEIVEAEYDLSSVVNDVVNMIQVKAREKDLAFNIKVNPDLPDTLFGDGMRLRQIMTNILNNAVKYTQKGSVTLDINGNLLGKDQLQLIISVTDTGIGIKEEDIGKLFTKFQRLDEGVNRAIEGSGLGLAITYSLLQIMNGEIDARSVYGEGSTFTILLPQKIVRNEAIGDFRTKYISTVQDRVVYHESFRAPDAKILVVDDTAVNHMVIKELLKLTKIQIDTAMSGKECLEMVQTTPYDLVLLDFRMPEMDGIETLHIMRALENNPNEKTPVIALTANAVTGARERFLSEGFDEYMIKPVEGPRLEEMLLHFLPKSKILAASPHTEAEEEAAVEKVAEESWTDALVGIDTATGIRNCGSESGYRSVLKIYYDGCSQKADEIARYYKEEDWENYTIQVHALKSSSRVIGAMELSRLAAELEKAGNELNLDRIRSDTDELLSMYRELGGRLGLLLEPAEEEKKEADELPPISESALRDAIETMKDFAKMYDYDNMIFVLDSLKEYRLSDEEADRMRKIRDFTEAFQWEEIMKILG